MQAIEGSRKSSTLATDLSRNLPEKRILSRTLSPDSFLIAVSLFALLVSFGSLPAQAQTETTLFTFSVGAAGYSPCSGLAMDASGNFYGVTCYGGSSNWGVVFQLVNNSGTYSQNTLYSLPGDGVSDHGEGPSAPLAIDASGNLYGTTYYGGTDGYGTVFELVNNSGTYSAKVLYSFTRASGINPQGNVIMDGSGNLYGTTSGGGANDYGTVFELVNNSGTYSFEVLYSFDNLDGAFPVGGLTMDGSGNLYGTTSAGGASAAGGNYGYGVVFELVNNSGSYSQKLLYSFQGNGDGGYPDAGLVMDKSGNLFGTTTYGGVNGAGNVLELVNNSGSYTENVLYSFPNSYSSDEETTSFYSNLIIDGSGNLYGTTAGGGANNDGTVFELVNSSGTYTFETLYNFGSSDTDGANPLGGVIMDALGNLYGTTLAGTVFELVSTTNVSAPAFTSANATSFQEGVNGAFTVTTTGVPTSALSESGALPSSVTFIDNGNGTGTLAGTPASGAAGTYPIVITATNAVGSTPQSFTLTVNPGLVITSSNMTTFTVSSTGFFSVTTSGSPTPSLSESGPLPSGVTFMDNGNGTATLTGLPAAGADGTYPITIDASNGVDADATQNFTLVVDQGTAITTGNVTTFTVGVLGNFTVTTTGYPTAAITESGALPVGVTFTDNGNGTATLTGTPGPDRGGSYPLTITANNGVGSVAMQGFLLVVNEGPAITSLNNTQFSVGVAGSFTVTTMGDPTPVLTETGALPSGFTFIDNGNGTATLSGTPALGSAGQYGFTIEASNGVLPNATQTFTLYVSKATIGISGTSSVNPSGLGQTVTFTVKITTPSSDTPTGTVTLGEGLAGEGWALKTETLPSSGIVTFKISNLYLGTNYIGAEYSGDANFAGPDTAAINPPQVVVPNTATTAITSSLNPSSYGEAVTFNVAVTPTSGTAVPTGTVVLSDGGNTVATLTLDGTGSASYSTSSLPAGTNNLTAAYGGDTNFSASSATLKQVVSKVASTLMVTPSASSIQVGQSETLDINVGPAFNGVVPTGTVTLKSAGTTLASLMLDSTGSASFTTTTLPAGNDNITVSYSGDSNYDAGTAKTTVPVTKIPVTIALNTFSNPYTLSGSGGTTFFINLTLASCCDPLNSGTITLKEGSTVLESFPAIQGTQSPYSAFVPFTTAGNFNMTVTYTNDPNYANASDTVVEQVVKATPTVFLSGLANAYFMQPFTLTAAVSGFVVPTGTVLIKDGSKTIDTATLASCPTCGVAESQVSFTTTSLSVGTHNFTADYLGDANFLATISSVDGPILIMPAPTTATLTSSLNPSTSGQAVTFTATIVGEYGGTPTGTVTFTDGTTSLKTVKLSGGTASYTTSSLTSGTHQISCSYSSDSNFEAGTCNTVTQTVQ